MSSIDKDKTRPATIHELLRRRKDDDDPPPSACLVVIHSPDVTLLTKRFELTKSPTTIGRGEDNDIDLRDDTVSRRHAEILSKEGGWVIVDLDSTNGMLLDQKKIRFLALCSGDRFHVGACLLKFLSGDDIERQWLEQRQRFQDTDQLTQTCSRSRLRDLLQEEIMKRKPTRATTCIVMIDIDHFKRINDVHGRVVGDRILAQLPDVMKPHLLAQHTLGRYEGDKFCVLSRQTDILDAAHLAEEIRRTIQTSEFRVAETGLNITANVGVISLRQTDSVAEEVLSRAETAVELAKRRGRNGVLVEDEASNSGGFDTLPDVTGSFRSILNGSDFFDKIRASNLRVDVVAFEIDDEAQFVEAFGWSAYEALHGVLVRIVEALSAPTNVLGTWRGRYVLVAVEAGSTRQTHERVAEGWQQHQPSTISRAQMPSLRHASLMVDEIPENSGPALDAIVGRLLRKDQAATDLRSSLPFPLAVLKSMVASRRTRLDRLRALVASIEQAICFIGAVELAAVAQSGEQARQRAARALADLHRYRAPGATYVVDLAPLISETRCPAIQGLIRGIQVHRLAILKADRLLPEVVRLLGRTGLSEDAGANEEEDLRALMDAILAAASSLAALRLISVADIERIVHDERKSFRHGVYSVYSHLGPGELFTIQQDEMPFILDRGDCYLVADDHSTAPLALSPLVSAGTCEVCRRVEVYLAKEIFVTPGAQTINVRGVTTNHERQWQVPQSTPGAELRELVRTILEEKSSGRREAERATNPSIKISDLLRDAGQAIPAFFRDSGQEHEPTSSTLIVPPRTVRVYLHHADADAAHVRRFESHMSPFEQKRSITLWHRGRLLGGEELGVTQDENLKKSEILLIFVSADLFQEGRVDDLLARVNSRRSVRQIEVVPIILRPCEWKVHPLGLLQPLPKDGSPIVLASNLDEAWSSVAAHVAAIARVRESCPPGIGTGSPR